MSLPHLQNPATPNTDDTPKAYPLPGVVKILCRELSAAVERGDYRQAESIRFALNSVAESTPVSAVAPAPVRPGYLTGAWLMTPAETNERMRSYYATVNPSAGIAEAEAHAARCGLAVIR
ncbi:Uncharacterised protein [Mycobacteroides abscessus subsp. abscessus]|uniref:hypothetical protein n=1 Tax=Mycobacteroides abscessus TaxID=36809 RepID=UPI0005E2FDC6|nr:hypothetical protein [Mycobacteroides abscessus]ANO17378.1 hypothetical protein BAB78_01235 [Mycobacteroides abscessus]MDB2220982.1 hypothetical protein [Mycobacteroides abscessus subsp. abscessus]OTR08829.1 hypothetical protein B9M85_01190 [Mycobacteroides abscessus]CPR89803.1 Uncharacterised protein [Mycobacteroides abscessus]SHS87224.1 Uncharacterised protein [Mycobacteroides abscessus subsp. abscessus]